MFTFGIKLYNNNCLQCGKGIKVIIEKAANGAVALSERARLVGIYNRNKEIAQLK